MAIEQLEILDFRCIAHARITPHAGTNLVVGANGSGKTSFLEALYVAGAGRSFRVHELPALVYRGRRRFQVFVRLEAPRQTLEVAGGPGGLELRLNGQALRGSAALAALLPMQALYPQMHALIDGPPEERRRFMDWGAFHVKPDYLEIWRRYHRALRQRNAALKQGLPAESREVWDAELAPAGELVHRHRKAYAERLAPAFREVAGALLDAGAELRYRQGWGEELTLAQALESSANRDQLLKATQVGPQRADLDIRFDSVPARHLASRGQQKLLAVSLGLAQARVISEASPRQLVLLLDDPTAEIDGVRSSRLAEQIAGIPAQRFITALTRDVYPGHADRLFHVERGALSLVI